MGRVVLYYCLIEVERSAVPHLEPLDCDTLTEARIHAWRALREHRVPLSAHIFAGDLLVHTVHPWDRPR